MFIKYEEKIVNIDGVTNIVIEDQKIIFNLDYPVSIRDNISKLIPDYVYFYVKDKNDFDDIMTKINGLGWIRSNSPGFYEKHGHRKATNHELINPKQISFVKFEQFDKHGNKKNRIIINLRLPISFSGDIYSRTSDFIFFDYNKDDEAFEADCDMFTTTLEGIK